MIPSSTGGHSADPLLPIRPRRRLYLSASSIRRSDLTEPAKSQRTQDDKVKKHDTGRHSRADHTHFMSLE
jgi:hypothetical protein